MLFGCVCVVAVALRTQAGALGDLWRPLYDPGAADFCVLLSLDALQVQALRRLCGDVSAGGHIRDGDAQVGRLNGWLLGVCLSIPTGGNEAVLNRPQVHDICILLGSDWVSCVGLSQSFERRDSAAASLQALVRGRDAQALVTSRDGGLFAKLLIFYVRVCLCVRERTSRLRAQHAMRMKRTLTAKSCQSPRRSLPESW